MPDWKLRDRLLALVLALLALLAVAGGWALAEAGRQAGALATVVHDRLEPLVQLRAVERAYGVEALGTLRAVRQGGLAPAAALQRLDAADQVVREQWGAYRATHMVPRELELIPATEAAMRQLDQLIARARPALLRQDDAALARLADLEIPAALNALSAPLGELVAVQVEVARASLRQAPEDFRRTAWVVGTLTLLALAAGGLLALSVWSRHRRDQAAAEERAQRLDRFYRALSRTNQLIVRGPDEDTLFAELARICVDTGHAAVVRVDRVVGHEVQRVALAGPAQDVFGGVYGMWSLDDPGMRQTLLATALLSGEPVVFNDYQDNPGSAAFHDRARAAGIGSGAAFPLRRAGRVVGSYAVYAQGRDYFDEPLVALLAEIATDVSFALDRLDRDEEIRTLNAQLEQRVDERTAQLQAAVQALEGARDAAESGLRAKGEFVANMSHEIRTPINAVIGLTDLVLRTPLDARQRDYLQKTRQAADALLQLVDRILDFSKIEARRLELEALPFDPRALLTQVHDMLSPKAQEKGLAWRLVLDEALPALLVGDAQRLRQVLLNLAANALKFTQRGEVVLAAALADAAAAPSGTWRLRFSVRDTGIGMAADELARLFRPFVQADASTSRRFGGTGLGLVISKQLVELMGGTLQVYSTPGAGSEFSFTIEAGAAEADLGPAPAAPPAAAAAPAASPLDVLRGRRLLLVEDNELNQLVASDLLREVAGMQVVVAGDGPAALAALEALAAQGSGAAFDVVMSDIQMPGMDGYELTRRIRARPEGAALPIVAVTAHASVRDRELCEAAGMDGYLTKPFDPQQLFRVLAGALADAAAPDRGAPRAPAAARGGVLFQLGLERCLGKRELYARIVRRYLTDRADLPQRLHGAWEDGRAEEARILVHNLISTAGTIGAVALSDLARSLQDALIKGPGERVGPLLQALSQEHAAVAAALVAYVEEGTAPV